MKIGPDATCARCGRPADGYATINGERYCHGDDPEPSCYMRQSWANSTTGGVGEVRLAHIVAQAIRVADGQHTMGAGALGEVAVAAILPHIVAQVRAEVVTLFRHMRVWENGRACCWECSDDTGWVSWPCWWERDLDAFLDRPVGDA